MFWGVFSKLGPKSLTFQFLIVIWADKSGLKMEWYDLLMAHRGLDRSCDPGLLPVEPITEDSKCIGWKCLFRSTTAVVFHVRVTYV